MKMTVLVKLNYEWIWENRWKWITKIIEYWWKWIMNLQFVQVNYEWQDKRIIRSYVFGISNGYDEEFNKGLNLWICKDSKIRKFITFWQEPIILKSLIFTGAPHTSACSLIFENGGLAKGRPVRQAYDSSFARLRGLRDVELSKDYILLIARLIRIKKIID